MFKKDLETKKILSFWQSFLKGNVFYLPVLGPVYIEKDYILKVLSDLLVNAEEDTFLPYDKNKRWFRKKKENIILDKIIAGRERIIIPAINTVKAPELKLFCYGSQSFGFRLTEIKNLIKKHGDFENCSLYLNKKPEEFEGAQRMIIFLKRIGAGDHLESNFKGISPLHNLSFSIQKTIKSLGEEPGLAGFGFLWRDYIEKKKDIAPVICAVEGEKIIGAVGPLYLGTDASNKKYLLPPYFGVRKEYRKKGYGEKLWKTAMHFAHKKGAEYTLVQNVSGSPASAFYKKQRLEKGAEYYQVGVR